MLVPSPSEEQLLSAEPLLAELTTQFEQWRQTKTKRSDRIPEQLWNQAVALTERLPLRTVSKTLGLSSHDLKRRVRQHQGLDEPGGSVTFVEWPTLAPWAPSNTPTQIELQRCDGARIRVQYPSAPTLENLIRSFLGE